MIKRIGGLLGGLLEIGLALLLVSGGPVQAQGGASCDGVIDTTAAAAACSGLAGGMVCAGEVGVTATVSGTAAPLTGSRRLADVDAVTTSAAPDYGVSVLRLPGLGDGESLTGVLFGDATLTEVPSDPVAPTCEATSVGTVNVRAEPNTDATILGQLSQGEVVPITGRLEDATWWRTTLDGLTAWVFAELTPSDCDTGTMLVVDPATGAVTGGLPAPDFQGARLESSLSAPVCGAGPAGGLLLQAAAGGTSWRLNGLLLRLDGTALIQASANDVLALHVLEGQAGVEIGGVLRVADAEQLLRVPLRGGALESVPGPALDAALPGPAAAVLDLLPRAITPPAETSVAVAGEGEFVCELLPQSYTVPADGQAASFNLTLEAEQGVRISAAAEGGAITELVVLTPGGEELRFTDGVDGVQVAAFSAAEAGDYTVTAAGADGAAVDFGLTCGLPQVIPQPELQQCEAVLLRWDDVTGNQVHFAAPLGAQVSIIAAHDLPSQGAAGMLSVLDATGASLGELGFIAFPTEQVAGQLVIDVPADGEYAITWDGDPFNAMDVEAVCSLPAPTSIPTESEATAS